MTRIEAEEAIMEKLKEIREIALAYAPERQRLSLFFIKGHLHFDNSAKTAETEGVLDCFEDLNDGRGMYSNPHGRKDPSAALRMTGGGGDA